MQPDQGERVDRVRQLARWESVLFMVGGSGFAIASVPLAVELVGAVAVAWAYAVSACFFTSAGFVQVALAWRDGRLRTMATWSSLVQSLGTLFFNVSTVRGVQEAYGEAQDPLIVWLPDAYGSICFLVSSAMAFWVLDSASRRRVHALGRGSVDLRATWWNMAGSILFGISAVAAYVVPDTGEPISAAIMNLTTMLGALCFVRAAWLVLPRTPDRG
jgi:hypothetical protein